MINVLLKNIKTSCEDKWTGSTSSIVRGGGGRCPSGVGWKKQNVAESHRL